MSFNRKIVLLGFLVLALGAFASYFSFGRAERESWQALEKNSREIAGWAGQNLEQKLLRLESSASHLNSVNLESMRKLGARYFAYVHKTTGEWSVNWKRLGSLEKEEILKEVGRIEFNEIMDQKRTWHFNQKNEAIYVTPVTLAASHQLQEGLLVFGLEKDFFKFVRTETSPVTLMTENHRLLEGDLPPEFGNEKHEPNEDEPGMMTKQVEGKDKRWVLTSYFSPVSQVWIFVQHSLSQPSYFKSLFFYIFLVGFCFLFLLFSLFQLVWDFWTLPVAGRAVGLVEKGVLLARSFSLFPSHPSPENRKIFKNKNPTENKNSEMWSTGSKEENLWIKTEKEETFSGLEIPEQILSFSEEPGLPTGESEGFEQKRLTHFSENSGLDETPETSDESLWKTKGENGVKEELFLEKGSSTSNTTVLEEQKSRLLPEDPVKGKKEYPKLSHPFSTTTKRKRVEEHTGDGNGAEKPPLNNKNKETALCELEKRVEEAFDGFRLRDFGFKPALNKKDQKTSTNSESQLISDENGLFEFDNGQIKIKIRSPKKKDSDASP